MTGVEAKLELPLLLNPVKGEEPIPTLPMLMPPQAPTVWSILPPLLHFIRVVTPLLLIGPPGDPITPNPGSCPCSMSVRGTEGRMVPEEAQQLILLSVVKPSPVLLLPKHPQRDIKRWATAPLDRLILTCKHEEFQWLHTVQV